MQSYVRVCCQTMMDNLGVAINGCNHMCVYVARQSDQEEIDYLD